MSASRLASSIRGTVVTVGPSALLDGLIAVGSIWTVVRAGRGRGWWSRVVGLCAALGATTPLLYVLAVRPWHSRWGATEEEVTRPLPGDDIVPKASVETTRSIDIAAPPADVYPWLVQIGQSRGGFYSYDWLENLAGLDIHSAEEILPDAQGLKVGDPVPFGAGTALAAAVVDPDHAVVIAHQDIVSWAFVVEPAGARSSRLIARFRVGGRPRLPLLFAYWLLIEIPHFIMERKMLLGIKARAERRGGRPQPVTPEPTARSLAANPATTTA